MFSHTGDEFEGTLGGVEHTYLAGEHLRQLEQLLIVGTVVSGCRTIQNRDAIWIKVSSLAIKNN